MQIAPPQLDAYKQIFEKVDADKDGHVSIKELTYALRSANIVLDKTEIIRIIKLVDIDNSNTLNLQEFSQLMYVFQNAQNASDATLMFLATDTDFSNTIDKNEFRRIIKKLDNSVPEKEIDDVMKQLATNDDGTIPFIVFTSFMGELLGVD